MVSYTFTGAHEHPLCYEELRRSKEHPDSGEDAKMVSASAHQLREIALLRHPINLHVQTPILKIPQPRISQYWNKALLFLELSSVSQRANVVVMTIICASLVKLKNGVTDELQ